MHFGEKKIQSKRCGSRSWFSTLLNGSQQLQSVSLRPVSVLDSFPSPCCHGRCFFFSSKVNVSRQVSMHPTHVVRLETKSDHHGQHVQHTMCACLNHYKSISCWRKSVTVTVTLILITYPGRYNLYLQCTLRFPGAKCADNLNNRSTDCAHCSMYLRVETSITGSCAGWFMFKTKTVSDRLRSPTFVLDY